MHALHDQKYARLTFSLSARFAEGRRSRDGGASEEDVSSYEKKVSFSCIALVTYKLIHANSIDE